ncbi:MAG: nucleotidyl transferase AbiEii/AbiGii toxin family protein [Bacteroidales bacterium]|nr:nucleotidyl transferase AbiEii/AbiGii toxin family protein [Bacteroidales bacterium]
MSKKLHYNTVSPLLRDVLSQLMAQPEFTPFCLVGGTSLSLQLGHRISIDIDLFTDAPYGSLDFHAIQSKLRSMFPYCQGDCGDIVGMGASYIIGNSAFDSIKLDLFYTDPFIRPIKAIDNIRIASIEDIIAMKLDVIGRKGRKKDFWDLHELHDKYAITEMLTLYAERYPYNHTREELLLGLTNFSLADTDPEPNCLRSKAWPLIKLDFMEWCK